MKAQIRLAEEAERRPKLGDIAEKAEGCTPNLESPSLQFTPGGDLCSPVITGSGAEPGGDLPAIEPKALSTKPVARAGSPASGLIGGICPPAFVDRKASTPDALGEPVAQTLKLGD